MDALARLRDLHERWRSLVTDPESRYADLSKAEADFLDAIIDPFPEILAELAAGRQKRYLETQADWAGVDEANAAYDAARRATEAAMGER